MPFAAIGALQITAPGCSLTIVVFGNSERGPTTAGHEVHLEFGVTGHERSIARARPGLSTTGETRWGTLFVFDRHHGAAFSLVELQDFFAQAEGLRGDLDVFIVGDELDGLFQIQIAEGNQADRHVGGR